ncbi:MAG: hypothetical protein HYR63_07185 [Proteobacteria bacterium]|nr:hypothetical protein [Pseudomonadota bacterium]
MTLKLGEVHPASQPYSIFGPLDGLAIGAYDTISKRRIFCAVTQEAFAAWGGDGSEDGSRKALAKNWQMVETMLSEIYDREGADESGRVILLVAGATANASADAEEIAPAPGESPPPATAAPSTGEPQRKTRKLRIS